MVRNAIHAARPALPATGAAPAALPAAGSTAAAPPAVAGATDGHDRTALPGERHGANPASSRPVATSAATAPGSVFGLMMRVKSEGSSRGGCFSACLGGGSDDTASLRLPKGTRIPGPVSCLPDGTVPLPMPPQGKVLPYNPRPVAANPVQQVLVENMVAALPAGTQVEHQDPILPRQRAKKFPTANELDQHFALWAQTPAGHGYVPEGCFARAHVLAAHLQKNDFDVGKVFVRGTIPGQLATHSPEYPNNTWTYHVAPIAFVKQGGEVAPRILDASIASRPLTLAEWTQSFNPSGAPLKLAFCDHAQIYEPRFEGHARALSKVGLAVSVETCNAVQHFHDRRVPA